jgi:dihydropyrimidinase
LELVYSAGVVPGALSPERWVEACCANPARIFGLYPQKGALAPGSDADVVVFNPEGKRTLRHDQLQEAVDYSPYEGLSLYGRIEQVYKAGRLKVEQGDLVEDRGDGRYLKRSAPIFC